MKDENDDSLAPIGCKKLAAAANAQVAIATDVAEEFESLDNQKQGRLLRIMEMWCEGRQLLPKMLNRNEGRSSRLNIMLQAFKGFKHRFYGFDTSFKGKRTFIIVDADLEKKRDKADPAVLKRAQKRTEDMQDLIHKVCKE